MRFHCRSILSCCTGLVVAASAVVRADDASTLMPEPAVVLTLAGIDRTLEDAEHLFAAAGRPQGMALVQAYLAKLNQLQGLDRTRPLGVMLFLDTADPDREPAPLVFVPVTALDDLRRTIELTGNALEPTGREGIYTLRLGKDRLTAATENNLLLVMRADQASAHLLNDVVLQLAAEPPAEFDLMVRLRRTGLPPKVFDHALSRLAEDIERDSQLRPDESEADQALRVAILDAVGAFARLVLLQTDELRFGGLLTGDDGGTLQCDLSASDDGALRRWLQTVLRSEGGPLASDAATDPLSLAVSLRLTERSAELAERILTAARAHVREDLARAVRPEEAQAAEGLFDALVATVRTRRLAGTVRFRDVAPGPFVFLAAVAVERADAVDQALRVVLHRVEESGDVEGVEFDQTLAGEVRFHQVRGTTLRERDVRLYGEGASLFVGAGAGRAWLAVGGEQTAGVLKEAVASSADGGQPPSGALQFRLHLRPWTALAAAPDSDAGRLNELLRQVFPESDPEDRLDVTLASSDRGARLTARFEEGYVRLFARLAALRAGK
jgi:hypothetical protein